MRICVLGATSQIAQDFISTSFLDESLELVACSRRPAELKAKFGAHRSINWVGYEAISNDKNFDLILNFVGVTKPGTTTESAVADRQVAEYFDEVALQILFASSSAKYIHVSSGAAYGHDFNTPANGLTVPSKPRDNYGLIKYELERKHRKLDAENIVDLRIFSYFSRKIDLSQRYFLNEVASALLNGRLFETDSKDFWRDYIDPENFWDLARCLYEAPAMNAAVDAFSIAPVRKIQLLEHLRTEVGLDFNLTDNPVTTALTGLKPMYFSTNHAAEKYGYKPSQDSLGIVTKELRSLLVD